MRMTALLLFVLTSCSFPIAMKAKEGPTIEVRDLPKVANSVDGKFVTLRGYLTIGNERSALHSNRKFFSDWDKDSCVALDFKKVKNYKIKPDKRTLISGVFSKQICPDNSICIAPCRFYGLDIVDYGDL